MEFDIGNILYIVITLVAVIVGLAGRKKKPSGQGTEGGQEGSSSGFFESLEEAFNMGQRGTEVVELREDEPDLAEEVVEDPYREVREFTEEVTPQQQQVDAYTQYLQRQNRVDQDIILTESDAITEPLEVIHLDEDDGTDYFEVVKEFNAATAVVYSTIINRLDY